MFDGKPGEISKWPSCLWKSLSPSLVVTRWWRPGRSWWGPTFFLFLGSWLMLDGFWKNLAHYHEILSSLTSLWFLGFWLTWCRDIFFGLSWSSHPCAFNFREGTNRLLPVDAVKISMGMLMLCVGFEQIFSAPNITDLWTSFKKNLSHSHQSVIFPFCNNLFCGTWRC